MAFSVSQPPRGSSSRSHSSVGEYLSQVDTWLQSSNFNDPSSASSTATTLPGHPKTMGSSIRSRSKSSVETHERLRLAELELSKLRRDIKGEQARASDMRQLAEMERTIAERLKLEGSAPGISSSEARLRISQLKRDVHAAGAERSRSPTTGMFKAACSTDLLFLIDTTSPIGSYISSAKAQVRSIMKDIKATFRNEAEIQVEVVGDKDHGDAGNTQFLDFTPSTDQVVLFLQDLHATDGDDQPEDILGGLKQALNASWKQQTRCIIHIGDAPPHGHMLQNSPPCTYDRWTKTGSEPHGLTHGPLLQQMINLRINYAFLHINGSTDKMAFTFFKAYAEVFKNFKLHTANRYYSRAGVIAATTLNNV